MNEYTIPFDETEQTKRGEILAQKLNLKKIKGYNPPRYETDFGTKTALGLFREVYHTVMIGE